MMKSPTVPLTIGAPSRVERPIRRTRRVSSKDLSRCREMQLGNFAQHVLAVALDELARGVDDAVRRTARQLDAALARLALEPVDEALAGEDRGGGHRDVGLGAVELDDAQAAGVRRGGGLDD